MRIDRKRLSALLILLVLLLSALAPSISVLAASVLGSLPKLPSRRNERTGYSAVIADEADLLSASEEAKLLDEMYPLTEYANIAIYTVSTSTSMKDYERARKKRVELFGTNANAAIFTIDMYLRRIVIQRRGNMEKFFNNSRANNITNNVASMATQKKYYSVCSTAMRQMRDVIQERDVPEPMRYLSNAVIALMLGCITAFVIAVLTSSSIRKKKKNETSVVRLTAPLVITVQSYQKVSQRTVTVSDSSSSSSCSSSSCGSSCSSCGSSCGGSSF